MAETESGEERTEAPSDKRLKEARDRGQVARSRELSAAAVTTATAAALLFMGGSVAAQLGQMLRTSFSLPRSALDNPEFMLGAFARAVVTALTSVSPLLATAALAALIAPLALGGIVWSPGVFVPDFTRLSPVEGLKRIFGLQGLAELIKALLKLVVVGTLAATVSFHLVREMVALGSMDPVPGIGQAGYLIAKALVTMSAGLVLIAAIDAPFQWWSHRQRLKMTREELREEMKETEGRPEVKSKVRDLQRRYSRQRMMKAVPGADVVVANPTHYAVALKYEANKAKAPRVLAKGRDLVALEIRRIASECGVPVFEAPALARALYGTTDMGREIPPGLYLAVAQVLSYIYQLKTLTPQRAARLKRPQPTLSEEFAKYTRDDAAGEQA